MQKTKCANHFERVWLFEVVDTEREGVGGKLGGFLETFYTLSRSDFSRMAVTPEGFDGMASERVPSSPQCPRLLKQMPLMCRTTLQSPSSLMPLVPHDPPSQTTPPASSRNTREGLSPSQR